MREHGRRPFPEFARVNDPVAVARPCPRPFTPLQGVCISAEGAVLKERMSNEEEEEEEDGGGGGRSDHCDGGGSSVKATETRKARKCTKKED